MAEAQGTGWFSAPNEIFERDDLTVNERVALLFLCRTVGADGSAWPSYARIGKACGMSPRSAINAVQSLIEKGLVLAAPRYDEKGRRISNVYRLRFGNRQGATGAPPYARGAQPDEQDKKEEVQVSGYASDAQAYAGDAGGPMHEVHPPYARGAQEGHPFKVTHRKDTQTDHAPAREYTNGTHESSENSSVSPSVQTADVEEFPPPSDAMSWPDVTRRYQRRLGMLGPTIFAKLEAWHEQGVGAGVLAQAIDVTAQAKAERRIRGSPDSYLDGVIRGMWNDGIRAVADIIERKGPQTLEDFEAMIEAAAARAEEGAT